MLLYFQTIPVQVIMPDSESESGSENSITETQSTSAVNTQDYQTQDSQKVKNKQVLKLRDASMKVIGIVKTPNTTLRI